MSDSVTEARILDLLADAVQRGDWAWTWHHGMTDAERLAFDLFLVRTGDPLAFEAGTPESRFRRRVEKMMIQLKSWRERAEK